MGELAEALNPVIEEAKQRLESGEALNEKAVEYMVVMPIVRALGWNPQNPDEMRPEYAVESRRVDWAFLKDGRPCLFLEEKAPDQNLSGHEEQLLEYAFKQGIRLAVLTNGREWWFYLPLEEALWRDRKFLVIDLMTREIDSVCVQLKQFLRKDLVHRGFSYKKAKKRYDEARERNRIRDQLPQAICALLLSPSPEVIEFFQNQTQGVIGALPPGELVDDALKAVFASRTPVAEAQADQASGTVKPPTKGRTGLPPLYSKVVGLAIKGEALDVRTWRDVLVETANWLIAEGYGDQLPYEKCPGTKRVLVSKSKGGLTAPKRLTNDAYIDSYSNSTDMVNRTRWLLKQVGLPEDILQVQWEERTE